MECRITLDGFAPKKGARAFELNGSDSMAHNEIGHPDNVKIEEKAINDIGPGFGYVFPAHSATVIEMDL